MLGMPVNAIFSLNRVVDFIFLADLIVNFFRAYYKDGQLIVDKKRIAVHYVKTWFIIDLVSCVPFDMIGILEDNDTYIRLQSLRVLRLLRLLRLMKMLRISRLMKLYDRWNSAFEINYGAISLAKFLVVLILIGHWMACFWVFVAQLQTMEDASSITWMTGYYDEADSMAQYAASLYFAICTCVTIGYGDITPTNALEHWIVIIMMLLGAGMWAYIVGNATSIITSLDKPSIIYHETMDDLNSLMNSRNFPPSMRVRLREYFKHLMLNVYSNNDENADYLMQKMSPNLRGDCALHCNGDVIYAVPYFRSFFIHLDEKEGEASDTHDHEVDEGTTDNNDKHQHKNTDDNEDCDSSGGGKSRAGSTASSCDDESNASSTSTDDLPSDDNSDHNRIDHERLESGDDDDDTESTGNAAESNGDSGNGNKGLIGLEHNTHNIRKAHNTHATRNKKAGDSQRSRINTHHHKYDRVKIDRNLYKHSPGRISALSAKAEHRDFVIQLALAMKNVLYAPREEIATGGQELNIVVSGILMIDGKPSSAHPPSYWGEDFLLDNPALRLSPIVRALTFVHAVRLSRRDLDTIEMRSYASYMYIRKAKMKMALLRYAYRVRQTHRTSTAPPSPSAQSTSTSASRQQSLSPSSSPLSSPSSSLSESQSLMHNNHNKDGKNHDATPYTNDDLDRRGRKKDKTSTRKEIELQKERKRHVAASPHQPSMMNEAAALPLFGAPQLVPRNVSAKMTSPKEHYDYSRKSVADMLLHHRSFGRYLPSTQPSSSTTLSISSPPPPPLPLPGLRTRRSSHSHSHSHTQQNHSQMPDAGPSSCTSMSASIPSSRHTLHMLYEMHQSINELKQRVALLTRSLQQERE